MQIEELFEGDYTLESSKYIDGISGEESKFDTNLYCSLNMNNNSDSCRQMDDDSQEKDQTNTYPVLLVFGFCSLHRSPSPVML